MRQTIYLNFLFVFLFMVNSIPIYAMDEMGAILAEMDRSFHVTIIDESGKQLSFIEHISSKGVHSFFTTAQDYDDLLVNDEISKLGIELEVIEDADFKVKMSDSVILPPVKYEDFKQHKNIATISPCYQDGTKEALVFAGTLGSCAIGGALGGYFTKSIDGARLGCLGGGLLFLIPVLKAGEEVPEQLMENLTPEQQKLVRSMQDHVKKLKGETPGSVQSKSLEIQILELENRFKQVTQILENLNSNEKRSALNQARSKVQKKREALYARKAAATPYVNYQLCPPEDIYRPDPIISKADEPEPVVAEPPQVPVYWNCAQEQWQCAPVLDNGQDRPSGGPPECGFIE